MFQNQRYIWGNVWVGTGAVTSPKLALYILLELPPNPENACFKITITFLIVWGSGWGRLLLPQKPENACFEISVTFLEIDGSAQGRLLFPSWPYTFFWSYLKVLKMHASKQL